ncbi:MAG: histone deacetylase family protein [Paracoccaceae bacterium]
MKIIYSDAHKGHAGALELRGEVFVPMAECPERMEVILAALANAGLRDVAPPKPHGLAEAARIHDPAFLTFLETAYPLWEKRHGPSRAVFARTFDMRGMAQRPQMDNIDAMLSAYTFDIFSPFVPGTWEAIRSALDVTLTAAGMVQQGAREAFALCRPPGHHASGDLAGGYCYLNNAAIAAQMFRDQGAARVAILDIDYHHGNGTQRIFYDRDDVLFISLHGRPEEEYPFLLGFTHETGAGQGEGFNLNLPMPPGTRIDAYLPALEAAAARVRAFAPDVLVLSLGVDTFDGDPVGGFCLQTPDYLRLGQVIAGLGLPTLFVMEGGYAIEPLGQNVTNVLTGYLQG